MVFSIFGELTGRAEAMDGRAREERNKRSGISICRIILATAGIRLSEGTRRFIGVNLYCER